MLEVYLVLCLDMQRNKKYETTSSAMFNEISILSRDIVNEKLQKNFKTKSYSEKFDVYDPGKFEFECDEELTESGEENENNSIRTPRNIRSDLEVPREPEIYTDMNSRNIMDSSDRILTRSR